MTFEVRRPPRPATPGPTPSSAEFVEFLEANPNTWARLHTFEHYDPAATRRKRCRKKYGPDGFEFVTRREPDGFAVYGRKVVPTLARTLVA